jgi:hypothetical protein
MQGIMQAATRTGTNVLRQVGGTPVATARAAGKTRTALQIRAM